MTAAGQGPSWSYEEAALQRGFRCIGGVDEAGRGPIAGPVVAACVVLPPGAELHAIRDSKQLSETARNRAYQTLKDAAAGIGIGIATPSEIDSCNILRATHLAMVRALEACRPTPDCALIDGLPVPFLPVRSQAIVNGDAICMSIAAASIIAKVTRDNMMLDLDAQYPGYGFARNKGYPTVQHLEALRLLGPCDAHRRSFAPVRELNNTLFGADTGSARCKETGDSGEAWARHYLERLGHRILATGYRHGRGEIDIISDDHGTLVFTEVKSSGSSREESPAARLTEGQRTRILSAAEGFVAETGMVDTSCRFDVIEVRRTGSRMPAVRHYRAAFLPERPVPSAARVTEPPIE